VFEVFIYRFALMKYIPVVIILFLISCKQGEIANTLKQSDEITVRFYLNSHSDSVIKILHTNNKDAITKLANFVDSKQKKDANCGRDGDITFKRNGMLVENVYFNVLQKDCREFFFYSRGTEIVTEINNEASDFLTAMWSGKNYY
jgi:hypothetical protein